MKTKLPSVINEYLLFYLYMCTMYNNNREREICLLHIWRRSSFLFKTSNNNNEKNRYVISSTSLSISDLLKYFLSLLDMYDVRACVYIFQFALLLFTVAVCGSFIISDSGLDLRNTHDFYYIISLSLTQSILYVVVSWNKTNSQPNCVQFDKMLP